MSRSYSVKEASLILGFSTNSIYKFLDQGRLRSSRGNSATGRFRIPHSSLEKFVGTTLAEEAIDLALAEHTLDNTQMKKEFSTPTDKVLTAPQSQIVPPADTAIPLKIIRGLILIGLAIILIDALVSDNFSLFQQLLRLGLLAILIVLTYQFGGLSHNT